MKLSESKSKKAKLSRKQTNLFISEIEARKKKIRPGAFKVKKKN